MEDYLGTIFRFVFLVILQGLVLNNVDLFGFVSPYLYILVILLFPLGANKSMVLFLSFLLGMSVDMFSHTWGMHTSASVFAAFMRPGLLTVLAPRDGYPLGTRPDMSHMGINWFLAYSFLLIFFHHIFLFFVEAFRFSEFFYTLGRSIANMLFTFALVIVSQFLTFREKRVL